MKAAFSVDIEPDLKTGSFKGIERGLPILIGILNQSNIKATFFVTGKVIQKYPALIRGLHQKGHEIALHGYRHLRYDTLSVSEKKKDLQKAVNIYKKVLKSKPLGFRAPQHSIDCQTISLLEKHNFVYDSSMTPGNIMLLRHICGSKPSIILRNFFSKMVVHPLTEKIFEVPRPSFLIASGGFELKLYPSWCYKLIISLCKIFHINFIFVMHSWDMIDIPGSLTNRLCSSNQFIKNLKNFLAYSSKKLKYVPECNLI